MQDKRSDTTATTLYLSGNNIGDEGAIALAKNTTITTLNLYWNNIGDRGVKALAKNTTITTLDLSYNLIEDKGAKALAKNTTIAYLDLCDNEIGDQGKRILAMAMAIRYHRKNILIVYGTKLRGGLLLWSPTTHFALENNLKLTVEILLYANRMDTNSSIYLLPREVLFYILAFIYNVSTENIFEQVWSKKENM